MMLVSLLLPRWFHSHMAFALGICSSSSGLATVIFPPILTPVMDRYSLRAGLLISAGTIAVCAFLVLLMIRDHPRDLKMTAFSDTESEKKNTRIHKSAGVHTRRAVLLAVVAYGFFAGLACAGCSQISMLYTAAGYTSSEVALIMSLYGGVLTVAKIIYGKLEDLFGNRYIGLSAFVIEIIGSSLMCMCRSHLLGFTGAILFGRRIRTCHPDHEYDYVYLRAHSVPALRLSRRYDGKLRAQLCGLYGIYCHLFCSHLCRLFHTPAESRGITSQKSSIFFKILNPSALSLRLKNGKANREVPFVRHSGSFVRPMGTVLPGAKRIGK